MDIIILLIIISLSIALGFLVLFIWNIRSGQYDDTYTPSVRMLFGDKKKAANFTPRQGSGQAGSSQKRSEDEKEGPAGSPGGERD